MTLLYNPDRILGEFPMSMRSTVRAFDSAIRRQSFDLLSMSQLLKFQLLVHVSSRLRSALHLKLGPSLSQRKRFIDHLYLQLTFTIGTP